MDWTSFTFKKIIISYKVITLKLKRAFNTAHSSSTIRNNFVFKLEYGGLIACGQCGLPPKKPLIYLADINDCKAFYIFLSQILQHKKQIRQQQGIIQNILQGIPQSFFQKCRHIQLTNQDDKNTMIDLFQLIQISQKNIKPQFKAAISALQFAILDLLSKMHKQSLSSFIFSKQIAETSKAISFYTISYEQNMKSMIQNAVGSLQYTRYIKIKFIDQIDSLLQLLLQLQNNTHNLIKGYIIDANASWKVQSFKYFNEKIMQQAFNSFNHKILYIQQPFPVSLQPNQLQQWKAMKQISKIKIMADQSFSDQSDIQKVSNLVHGVNIKTQKAAGPLNVIRAAIIAKLKGLDIMFGSMVSTHLGSSQTYCLYPLSRMLDVDGSLLVEQPQVQGGFRWGGGQQLIHPKQQYYGLQINYKFLQH